MLEYAYAEARRHTVAVFTRLVGEYDFDGIYICPRTHSRPADGADKYGFSEPVAVAYTFSSLSLDNRPASVVVPADPRLDFADGKLTVECWLKYPAEVTYGRVVSKYDHTIGDEGRGWDVYIDEDAHVIWRLNDGISDLSIKSEGVVTGGEWFHLACVSEGAGGETRVYINGRPGPATRLAPAALRRVPLDLCIGSYGGGGVLLAAWIDELRLSRVARQFNGAPSGRPEIDAHTVALWSFEEDGAEVKSTCGAPALFGTTMRVGGPIRGERPPNCGQAIFLGVRR